MMELLLVCLLHLAAVNNAELNQRVGQREVGTYPVAKNDSEEIVSYFTAQLAAERISAINPAYYQQIVHPDSLSFKKKELWALWKRANSDRLASLPIASSSGVEFVWEIPQNQQMKVEVFTKGDKPGGGYPFFINLHGGGRFPKTPGPSESPINSSEWRAAKMLGRQYKDSPSLYFVPRMADDRVGRWYLLPQQVAWLRAWQLAVLSGQVDPNKTYIVGISEGSYGSLRMGTFYADYFAGIGPMAGPEAATAAPIENLRNTAIRIEVGELDTGFERNIMGADWQRRLDSAAQANPGQFDHEVVIQQGRGHGINYHQVTPWLVQKTRNAYPDTLSFMYYDIDGGYRNGFGYVRLDGLTRDGSRKSFKVVKQGNTYDISTADVSGAVSGKIALYLEHIDYTTPVTVILNGREVFRSNVACSVGVMIESIAVFGDPNRIFASKIELAI